MATSITIPLPVGVTGLTMLGSLVTGTTLHATLRNLACAEIGTSGTYVFSSVAIPDDYRGEVMYHTGSISALAGLTTSNTYGAASLNPEDVASGSGLTAAQTRAALGMAAADLDDQLDAIAAKTILITSGNVSVVSPVGPTGATISLVNGADYYLTDGLSLPFTATGVPSLVGGSVELRSPGLSAPLAGVVVDATHCYFQIPRASSLLMTGAPFQVWSTLANTHVEMIADGVITVKAKI